MRARRQIGMQHDRHVEAAVDAERIVVIAHVAAGGDAVRPAVVAVGLHVVAQQRAGRVGQHLLVMFFCSCALT